MSLFSYIRDERSRANSYPYTVKEGQRYTDLNPGRLFVQQPPKREKDREASAYNRGRQVSHHKTKLNKIRQKQACILN